MCNLNNKGFIKKYKNIRLYNKVNTYLIDILYYIKTDNSNSYIVNEIITEMQELVIESEYLRFKPDLQLTNKKLENKDVLAFVVLYNIVKIYLYDFIENEKFKNWFNKIDSIITYTEQ